jgi:hypothetical protein
MSLVFRQTGVYLKTFVGVVVAAFLLLFFLANRGNLTEIWVFRQFKDTQALPTNWVVFVSIVAGVFLWWLCRWMLTLPGQWRALRQDAVRQELPPDKDAGAR